MTWESSSPEETQSLAMSVLSEALARNHSTPLILLSGELGAGKTTFTQALAALLCVDGVVTSPTFTLERRYEARHTALTQLIHLDLYRITDPAELRPLHIEDTLRTTNALIVVEWPEHGGYAFPEHAVRVTITHTGADHRLLTLV